MISLSLQSVLVCFFILGGLYIIYPLDITLDKLPKKDSKDPFFEIDLDLSEIFDEDDD